MISVCAILIVFDILLAIRMPWHDITILLIFELCLLAMSVPLILAWSFHKTSNQDNSVDAATSFATDSGTTEQTILCPHCIKPVDRFDHLCPHCSGPITAHAAIGPLEQVYAAGHAYQNATSPDRPRKIIVLGMWLIFGPSVLMYLVYLAAIFSSDSHSEPEINWVSKLGSIIVMAGTLVLFSVILWKVTRSYQQGRAGQSNFE